MKKYLCWLFLVCLTSCYHVPKLTVQELNTQMVLNHTTNSTVALVEKGTDTKWHVTCGAVWVSTYQILTARHCVEDDDNPNENQIGNLVPFVTNTEVDKISKPHYAVVLAMGKNTDLALLSSVDNIAHEILRVNREKLWIGQNVYILGHPLGLLTYSFSTGMISSKEKEMTPFEEKWNVLQIYTSVVPGNSGGPAVDVHGNLIGICSLLNRRIPGMAFFMSSADINKFLDEETGTQIYL